MVSPTQHCYGTLLPLGQGPRLGTGLGPKPGPGRPLVPSSAVCAQCSVAWAPRRAGPPVSVSDCFPVSLAHLFSVFRAQQQSLSRRFCLCPLCFSSSPAFHSCCHLLDWAPSEVSGVSGPWNVGHRALRGVGQLSGKPSSYPVDSVYHCDRGLCICLCVSPSTWGVRGRGCEHPFPGRTARPTASSWQPSAGRFPWLQALMYLVLIVLGQ